MKKTPSIRIVFLLPAFVFFLLVSVLMAEEPTKIPDQAAGEVPEEEGGDAAVHIVYVDRPETEEAEAFHIRTLASVVGSEEKAKDAVIYHYTHAASGFSAKLTPKQVEELSKQPGVLQVVPSQTYTLFGPGGTRGAARTMGIL
uniref:Subtilisin-like protease SBT3.9 n=1 Tax=Elaeis guineensis var. tenera TaxID=51953 RepID=A0A6I9QPH8_ELAGV|nr:subtilisin-like protease SBT3.9 [Elaeis guineensis]XP_010911878.1 subtilisin-like protease SBT3.9 [Elaeis guineensis]